jgi:hypothetical protein
MSDDPPKPRSQADADLQKEILRDRKFSLSEAIGRLAGPGAMKGASPIGRKQQAEAAIDNYLQQHLSASSCLPQVLLRQVSQSELLLRNYDQPLVVLAASLQRILDSDYLLRDTVRELDVEWGRVYGERPHFDQEGQSPDPDDPYTCESVRASLSALMKALQEGDLPQ